MVRGTSGTTTGDGMSEQRGGLDPEAGSGAGSAAREPVRSGTPDADLSRFAGSLGTPTAAAPGGLSFGSVPRGGFGAAPAAATGPRFESGPSTFGAAPTLAGSAAPPAPPAYPPPAAPAFGGWAPSAGPQPGGLSYAPGPQPNGWGYPPATKASHRRVWLIVIGVVAGVLGLMIAAAVVVPVFLNQRAQTVWKATSVSLPQSIDGQTRLTDTASVQLAESMKGNLVAQAGRLYPEPIVALYGSAAGPKLLVVAARPTTPPSARDYNSFFAGFRRGVTSGAPAGATFGPLETVDPGRLGGTMKCLDFTVSGHSFGACAAVDAGATVSVFAINTSGPEAANLAVQARETVVHRG